MSAQTLWYHGTDEYFTEWCSPPAKTRIKAALHPHPFISFSSNITLASTYGKITGGLCRARLAENARVLDLQQESDDSDRVREAILQTEIGKHHHLLESREGWINACRTGEILRMHTRHAPLIGKLDKLDALLRDEKAAPSKRQRAFLKLQNFTRRWINCVIEPARQLGYQAVVCAEIDRYAESGQQSNINLYVFDPSVLEKPDWQKVPDSRLVELYLRRVMQPFLGGSSGTLPT